MGRPPLGKVATSDAERHRRYMARLRQRATAPPAPAPTPTPFVAPDGPIIRVDHLALDPVCTARWLCRKLDELGNRAQAFGDAYNQALANRTIAAERDE